MTLQPLPSSLTRALDSASPNPCPVSTGPSSDPVAPVSHQVAPLQMAIHSAWPSPSENARSSGSACTSSSARTCSGMLAGWLLCPYKYRPPKALQCGPYAPVLGPSRPPYRPPLLLDDPVAPPVVRPSSSSALLGPPVLPPAGASLARPLPFCLWGLRTPSLTQWPP